jgi:tryptophan synthase alpha chain
LVSTAGVTGVRDTIASGALPLVERARAATDLPLALGFGLSKKEHMEAIAPYADAAIVGSAIMRVVEEAQGAADLPQRIEALAAELKSGLRATTAKS